MLYCACRVRTEYSKYGTVVVGTTNTSCIPSGLACSPSLLPSPSFSLSLLIEPPLRAPSGGGDTLTVRQHGTNTSARSNNNTPAPPTVATYAGTPPPTTATPAPFAGHGHTAASLLNRFRRSQDQSLMRAAALVRVSPAIAAFPPAKAVRNERPGAPCCPGSMRCTSARLRSSNGGPRSQGARPAARGQGCAGCAATLGRCNTPAPLAHLARRIARPEASVASQMHR